MQFGAVAFDSFSSMNLISATYLLEDLDQEPTGSIQLLGIGGVTRTSGNKTSICLKTHDLVVEIKAHLAIIPPQIDLLIGFPAMRKLGCVINMAVSPPMVHLAGSKFPIILYPLSDIVVKYINPVLISGISSGWSDDDIRVTLGKRLHGYELPKLMIEMSPTAVETPFSDKNAIPCEPKSDSFCA